MYDRKGTKIDGTTRHMITAVIQMVCRELFRSTRLDFTPFGEGRGPWVGDVAGTDDILMDLTFTILKASKLRILPCFVLKKQSMR